MKGILTCLALTIVLYGCKNGTALSPRNTVSSFIEAAREGNLPEVKKYITSSDKSLLEIGEKFLAGVDSNASKEMMDKMSKEFKAKTKDAKIEIKDEKVDGDNATVNVEFMLNGKSETHPFSLVKEEGQWKISLSSTGMKNAGTNQQDIEEAMKNVDMDSLKGLINKGMEGLDKDSLHKVLEEGLKEAEKLKDIPKNN